MNNNAKVNAALEQAKAALENLQQQLASDEWDKLDTTVAEAVCNLAAQVESDLDARLNG